MMSQNLSSAAVVIGALRVNEELLSIFHLPYNSSCGLMQFKTLENSPC